MNIIMNQNLILIKRFEFIKAISFTKSSQIAIIPLKQFDLFEE